MQGVAGDLEVAGEGERFPEEGAGFVVRAETILEHWLGATSSLPTLQSTSPLDTSDFVSHHLRAALPAGEFGSLDRSNLPSA